MRAISCLGLRPNRSEIEDYIVLGQRATDERAAVGGRLYGIGVVGEVAGDQGRLTVVADAGSARPSDGHVARLGELEQTAVIAAPRHREVAARELDRGAVTSGSGGQVRRAGRC